MTEKNNILGLFVGINKYKLTEIGSRNIDLHGCVNDAELISKLMKERYGLLDEHCLMLTDSKASKKSIVDGFRVHLAKAEKNDTAIFFFSGHGSTEKSDPIMWITGQTTNRNETLVCHDSRATDPYDLSDKELRILIQELSVKGVKVITIIDSCNSGDATRYLDAEPVDDVVTRQTPGSKAIRPLSTYLFYDDPKTKSWLDDFSNMPEGNHIALSACRNDQLSKEVYYGFEKYGVFTHSLCKAIEQQHFAPSYRNLVDLASQKVMVKVENQTPQLKVIGEEVDLNQAFLSSEIQPIAYPVHFDDDGDCWLNAGIAQGININARFALMDGDTRTLDATVVKVSFEDSTKSRSQLALIGEDTSIDQKKQYMAQMIDPAIPKLPVRFIGSDTNVTALADALSKSDVRYFVEQVEQGNYELVSDSQSLQLKRRVGLPLQVKPLENKKGKEALALKLAAHMSRWEHTKGLAYSAEENLIPDDLLSLVIEQQKPDNETFARLPEKDGVFDVYYQQDFSKLDLVKPKVTFSVEINCAAKWPENEDVFFSLLFMDPVKGSVAILANKEVLRLKERKDKDGNSNVLKPEKRSWTYTFTKNGKKDSVRRLSVPDILLAGNENPSGKTHDYLKLIVSNFEIDVSTLEQTSLKKLLDPTRGNKSFDDDDEIEVDVALFIPKASTKTYTLNIIKPPSSIFVDNKKAIVLSEKISVLPNDLQALASLEYSKDNPESATALRLELTGSESVGLNASSDNMLNSPLRVEIQPSPSSSDPENYIVFSEQESGYEDAPFQIPLGFSESDQSGNAQVAIHQLPTNLNSGDRSLSGSFLLLFKKIAHEKLNLEYDTARLAIPTFKSTTSLEVSDYLDDVATIKARVAESKKVLLFVHGITGDTERMAGVVNREIDGKRLGEGCLVLTFDYENLGTPLQQTADVLRKKLEAVGLTGEHGKELVVIAHSMGGLVSRWMIEKDIACPVVSKLVMLGTPNGGSPLRDVKKWLMVMLTLGANGISGGIAGASMGSLMFLLNRADDTLDEMGDSSQTLKYLYEAPDPKIPYYMIAGNTAKLSAEIDKEGSRLNRLLSVLKTHAWLGVTDLFSSGLFREENDIAVSFSSMKHIPAGRVHEMQFLEVNSDHLSYFDNKASIQHLYDII